MPELKEILARYYRDGGGYDVEDFVHAYGDPKQALLLFRVFWPEFLIVGQDVVLKTYIDAEGGPAKLLSQISKQGEAALSGYRWLEIPYLFEQRTELESEDDLYLAELVAETWRGALCYQFPEKKFVVQVLSPAETGSVVGVGFEEIV